VTEEDEVYEWGDGKGAQPRKVASMCTLLFPFLPIFPLFPFFVFFLHLSIFSVQYSIFLL
jgi:hypothetical protein